MLPARQPNKILSPGTGFAQIVATYTGTACTVGMSLHNLFAFAGYFNEKKNPVTNYDGDG